MSRVTSRPFNDRNDTHDRYTTSLIQQQRRQEQASAQHTRTFSRDYSRLSSSSGSAHTLRRTPTFTQPRSPRLRSNSVGSPTLVTSRSPDRVHHTLSEQISHRRAASAFYQSQTPHPALRISKRTRGAIQFALEEAIRHPNSFTPDLEEENAQMSDLGGGRAANGGSRTGGPVPVPSSSTPSIRTPRDVMRERNAREARRQEEKAEEARLVAEERRRSAERRAATVAGSAPRFSQASQQYAPDKDAQPATLDGAADRRSGGARVSGADVLGEPVGRTQEYPSGKTRGPSATQQDQPRPVQLTTGGTRRTQQSQSAPRQPSTQTTSTAPQQAQGDGAGQQRGTASSFPHAFERWETLSSHWEGLTSYWLHKLEQNTEEIRNTIPNASTLNRQITDLSAAGANLFHAVVELQRLRASSERKFQRWFFETRADTERHSETHGQLERQLRLERSAREEAVSKRAEAEDAAAAAKSEVAEMRRELMISKDEARRAWEELGRRNQESLETGQSLKEGRVVVVAGVQVVPYGGGPSRTGSATRPGTGHDPQPYAVGSPADERKYYRQEASPTNTDPFTESQQPLHHEPGKSSLASGTYMPAGGAATAGAGSATGSHQRPPPAVTGSVASPRGGQAASAGLRSPQESERFYQHGPGETFLHSPQPSSHAPTAAAGAAPPAQREDVRSEVSYVDTISEGETEYVIDAGGNIRHDEQGRPIVYRRHPTRSEASEEDDPEYDEEAIRHEQEVAARYAGGGGGSSVSDGAVTAHHTGTVMPEAPSVPATSAQAMATYTPTAGGPPQGRADYEGAGYGGWETLNTARHHHPTRLSDVLEEEEERSSRRMGD